MQVNTTHLKTCFQINVMSSLSPDKHVCQQLLHMITGSTGSSAGSRLTALLFPVFSREPVWRGRSGPWPTQSAPPSIQRTASATCSMSPRWRPSPASTGLSSNVPAHVADSSGSLSSRPGLRFTSTRPPSERTGPRAACSCRSGDPAGSRAAAPTDA